MRRKHKEYLYFRCPHCGRILPRTAEFFHKDRTAKDGLCYLCKSCKCNQINDFRRSVKGHRRIFETNYIYKGARPTGYEILNKVQELSIEQFLEWYKQYE